MENVCTIKSKSNQDILYTVNYAIKYTINYTIKKYNKYTKNNTKSETSYYLFLCGEGK